MWFGDVSTAPIRHGLPVVNSLSAESKLSDDDQDDDAEPWLEVDLVQPSQYVFYPFRNDANGSADASASACGE